MSRVLEGWQVPGDDSNAVLVGAIHEREQTVLVDDVLGGVPLGGLDEERLDALRGQLVDCLDLECWAVLREGGRPVVHVEPGPESPVGLQREAGRGCRRRGRRRRGGCGGGRSRGGLRDRRGHLGGGHDGRRRHEGPLQHAVGTSSRRPRHGRAERHGHHRHSHEQRRSDDVWSPHHGRSLTTSSGPRVGDHPSDASPTSRPL